MTQNDIIKAATILCIDDDPLALKLYKKYLENTEHSLLTAESAEEGFTLAKKHLPDLIISDIMMPGESGWDLCKKIKKEPYLKNSILLLASALETDPSHQTKGVDIGADDYLIKPLKKDEFLAKIKSFLRIKSLKDSLIASNKKLNKAMDYLKKYKTELEKKNIILLKEKRMIQNSLKQISIMSEERERANKELQDLNKIQKKNFFGLIDLLSSVIESKRQYHRGHSKKVSEISGFIAKNMDLSKNDVRTIEIASLLHEIGKLSISDDLSMKNPDEYTETEIALLSRHPIQGTDLLDKFFGFKAAAKLIYHFHENVDGSGVPDRLRGNDIPIGSRIIAAANVFDNLVYRKKNGSVDKAFEIMDEMTGSKLDSIIVFHLHKYAQKHPIKDSDKITSIKIFELEPGMKLAAGIFSIGGAKLLPVNTVITEESIKQLAHYNKKDPIGKTIFIK